MSKQTIFERLRQSGCTATGALALMGNWECESNCEPCRVQGDFQADRAKSRAYANRVDNGLMSEEEWCRDGKGWGLAQWTCWSRKRDLLTFCRRRSISVANEEAQVDFAVMELQNQYKALWADLTTCGEEVLYVMTELVCRKYEAPAINNIEDRYNAARRLRDELQGKAVESIDNSVELPAEDHPETPYWPPRMLCNGMTGADVQLLQALLLCHGFNPGGCSGIFDNRTRNMVVGFQAQNGLDQDGVAGPKTFKALGVRE